MNARKLLPLLLFSPLTGAWAATAAQDGGTLRAGADYYSIQLASGASAASLQPRLAMLTSAAAPYARIDRRGGVFILRVGFWQNRSDADALQARISLISDGEDRPLIGGSCRLSKRRVCLCDPVISLRS